jgi:hypothetical protein
VSSLFDAGTKLEMPTRVTERLKGLSSEEYWGLNHKSLNPRDQATITTHKFCEYSSEFLRRLVGRILTEIRAKLQEGLGNEVQTKIQKDAHDFCTTLSKMGNLTAQPYYFCPERFFEGCY